MINRFVSVDWGTTNLRIRLVDGSPVQVIEERQSENGIKKILDLWNHSGVDHRESFYLQILKSELEAFEAKIEFDIPIVISGMASSRNGLRELSYSELPIGLNGSDLKSEWLKSDSLRNPILLISGIKSDSDIIRGEEVQIIGLSDRFNLNDRTLMVLPGTHSKHVLCVGGVIEGFQTLMTGEIFDVIKSHSLLKTSISDGAFGKNERQSFQSGVERAAKGGSLLSDLFGIRVMDLFGTQSKTENYYYLSGLLVGEELAQIQNRTVDKVLLCAIGDLSGLYEQAFNILGLQEMTEIVPDNQVQIAVVRGQWIVLNQKNQSEKSI